MSSSRSKCGIWSVRVRICRRWPNAFMNRNGHCCAP
jgi:hypothetical protein